MSYVSPSGGCAEPALPPLCFRLWQAGSLQARSSQWQQCAAICRPAALRQSQPFDKSNNCGWGRLCDSISNSAEIEPHLVPGLSLFLSIKPLWASPDGRERVRQRDAASKGSATWRPFRAVRELRASAKTVAPLRNVTCDKQQQQQQHKSREQQQQKEQKQQQNAKVQSLMRKIRRNLSSPCQRGVISRKLRPGKRGREAWRGGGDWCESE